MERQSNLHSPRVDEEMQHEVESLTRGSPVEARIEESRLMEDAGDGEPVAQAIVGELQDAEGGGHVVQEDPHAREDGEAQQKPPEEDAPEEQAPEAEAPEENAPEIEPLDEPEPL